MQTKNYYPNIKKIIKKNVSFVDVAKKALYYTSIAEVYDLISTGSKYTKKEFQFLLSFIKKYCSGNKVLDLACGAGRHSRLLAKAGFKTVGIDQSKEMLKIARSKDRRTKYVLSDIRSFNVGKDFDLAFCLWSSYSYLSRKEDLNGFLNSAHKALKPGGFLILESRNYFKKALKLDFRRKVYKDKRFEIEIFIRKRTNLKTKVLDAVYVTLLIDKKTGKTHSSIDAELVRIYSRKDIERAIKGKFRIFKVLGNYVLGNLYQKDKSDRLIFILQKNL